MRSNKDPMQPKINKFIKKKFVLEKFDLKVCFGENTYHDYKLSITLFFGLQKNTRKRDCTIVRKTKNPKCLNVTLASLLLIHSCKAEGSGLLVSFLLTSFSLSPW